MASSDASVQPPKKKGGYLWLKILAGGITLLVGAVATEAIIQVSSYNAGHEAYLKADCDTAIPKFDRAIAGVEKPTGKSALAKQEKAECDAYKTAVNQQKSGQPSAALASYATFASNYKQSPLLTPIKTQTQTLLKEKPDKLADAKTSCKSLSSMALITSQPNETLPPIYLACGQKYEAAKDYTQAVQVYDDLLKAYPKAGEIALAKAGLARSLVAQANTTGAGALPNPEVSGSSGGDFSVVKIQNSSPNRIRIAFSGVDARVEEVEPCPNCQKYTKDTVPESCPTQGTVKEYRLKPGQYNIVVLSSDNSRVTPYKGQWDLNSGERYDNCFYIVTSRAN